MSYYERISMAKHEQPSLVLSIYELLHNEYILNVFYLFFCRYCGRGLRNKTLVSDGNLMIITFRSDVRTADKGFKAKIKAIPLRFGVRDRGNPTNFLGSFYSVFSANNQQTSSNSYLESTWNLFRSMSLSNIMG